MDINRFFVVNQKNQKTLAHVGQLSHVWRARKAQTAQTVRRLSCTCALSWQPYSAAFCRASSSSWYVPLMFHGKFCRRKTTGIGEKWGQFGQCYCQWLLVWVVTYFFKISAQASLSLKFQRCFKWGLDNTILPASHWRACLAALSRSSSCMEHMELDGTWAPNQHRSKHRWHTGGTSPEEVLRLLPWPECWGAKKIYFCQDLAIAVESDPTANRLVTELLNHEQLIAQAFESWHCGIAALRPRIQAKGGGICRFLKGLSISIAVNSCDWCPHKIPHHYN